MLNVNNMWRVVVRNFDAEKYSHANWKLCFKKIVMTFRNGNRHLRNVSYGSIFDIGYVNRFGEKVDKNLSKTVECIIYHWRCVNNWNTDYHALTGGALWVLDISFWDFCNCFAEQSFVWRLDIDFSHGHHLSSHWLL